MGRPKKGERGFLAVRVPIEQFEQYTQRASHLGLPYGDYAAVFLALAHGFPIPSYIPISPDQLALLEDDDAIRSLRNLDDIAKGA